MPLHRSSTYTVVLYLYVWQPCIGATFPFYRAIKSASFSFLLTISCWGKLHVRVLNMAHYFLPHTFFSSMGSTNNYVDKTLAFFNLPTSTWMFFTLNENVDKNKPLWFLNWIGWVCLTLTHSHWTGVFFWSFVAN